MSERGHQDVMFGTFAVSAHSSGTAPGDAPAATERTRKKRAQRAAAERALVKQNQV